MGVPTYYGELATQVMNLTTQPISPSTEVVIYDPALPKPYSDSSLDFTALLVKSPVQPDKGDKFYSLTYKIRWQEPRQRLINVPVELFFVTNWAWSSESEREHPYLPGTHDILPTRIVIDPNPSVKLITDYVFKSVPYGSSVATLLFQNLQITGLLPLPSLSIEFQFSFEYPKLTKLYQGVAEFRGYFWLQMRVVGVGYQALHPSDNDVLVEDWEVIPSIAPPRL